MFGKAYVTIIVIVGMSFVGVVLSLFGRESDFYAAYALIVLILLAGVTAGRLGELGKRIDELENPSGDQK